MFLKKLLFFLNIFGDTWGLLGELKTPLQVTFNKKVNWIVKAIKKVPHNSMSHMQYKSENKLRIERWWVWVGEGDLNVSFRKESM